MTVLKFGGTSVSTLERITTIGAIARKSVRPIIVVSAIRGVTDILLELPKANHHRQMEIIDEIKQTHMDLATEVLDEDGLIKFSNYATEKIKEIEVDLQSNLIELQLRDKVVSYGEILSSRLVAEALTNAGIKAEQVIATECIKTDDNFTNAEFKPEPTKQSTKKRLLPLIEGGIVPVITGFIGATDTGMVTTLGRGGSDYSASILAFSIEAEELQIWTDVDGMYTTDPRYFANAYLLSEVSYREAAELAAFGAKVLHPRTIQPAILANIPVKILNTQNPDGAGTTISAAIKNMPRITAIASKSSTSLVNLFSTDMLQSKGFLQRVFTVFAAHNISIDLVSVSEVSVSVTLDNAELLQRAVKELEGFCSVSVKDVSIVSIVGERIVSIPYILSQLFNLLDHHRIPVRMVSLGATDINISFVVEQKNLHDAVQILHQEIVLPAHNTFFQGELL